MTRKAWTPEDDARLATMRAKGYGFEAIALVTGHSAEGCKMRTAFHRETYSSPASDTKTKGKWRFCLRCKKKFWSTGPGNRLCPNCRHESLTSFDTPAQVLR